MRGELSYIICTLVLVLNGTAFAQSWNIPPLPPPSEYGNILIDRLPGKNEQPVIFSHWKHRVKYTCRVCHLELEFEMKVNTTEITEEKNKNGKFCGACHDGKIAFGHTPENCGKCHNGDITYGSAKFRDLEAFPSSRYGNQVDWTAAVSKGLIEPRQSLKDYKYTQDLFKKSLNMEPEWAKFPPAIFPHDVHNYWLDCANCHPSVFNIKKKTTEHFEMKYITKGKFCGLCHLSVAFPLNNCKRCHPDLGR